MRQIIIAILIIVSLCQFIPACETKTIRGYMNGRIIDLRRDYPIVDWQRDVWMRNPGNPNWWRPDRFEYIDERRIQINSWFYTGWEYKVILKKGEDCEFEE